MIIPQIIPYHRVSFPLLQVILSVLNYYIRTLVSLFHNNGSIISQRIKYHRFFQSKTGMEYDNLVSIAIIFSSYMLKQSQ